MYSLAFVLALVPTFVISSEVRDNIYQLQGVEVIDEPISERQKEESEQYISRAKRAAAILVPSSPHQIAKISITKTSRQAGYEQSYGPSAIKQQQYKKEYGNGFAYNYPERRKLPLPGCFYNPTGYICCNPKLNDVMVDTVEELEKNPKFHACNIQAIANALQLNTQKHFNTTFETIAAHEDFAQKVSFKGDLVCKVELGGRYMIAYGTPTDAYYGELAKDHRLRKREVDFEWGAGTEESWTSIHTSFI